MNCEPLDIEGAWLLRGEAARDPRGAFVTPWESARLYGAGPEFTPHSLHHSFNERAATLRGLHFQHPPHAQARLVTCTAGRLWDVVLDLRPKSSTYLRWSARHLEGAEPLAVFVPRGCAHGFVTLAPQTIVTYLIEGRYVPEAGAVVRWNDPRFAIAWPVGEPIVSGRDRDAPDYPG